MRPLTIRAETEVSTYLLQHSTASHAKYVEEQVRNELASRLARELASIMKVHRYDSHNDDKVVYLGEVIAMTWDDYAANYGTYDDRRRGISDGTMAIMQNGNWKIVSNQAQPIPTPTTKPTPKPAKSFDPSEYLRNRVMELQNDANK